MPFSRCLACLGLLGAVAAAPAPQMVYGENQGPIAGVTVTAEPSVSTPSGSLYGDSSLLGGNAPVIPAAQADSAVVPDPEFVPGQDSDADLGLYLNFNSIAVPQPQRGSGGSTEPGPRTYAYERLNPDTYAPPGTDNLEVPQAMWPMGLSHVKPGKNNAGWSRQQNKDVLPVSTQMAGVDMRLEPYAYRELHWHTSSEWALVLKGTVRIAAMNEDGQNIVDDVNAGDVWFFPAGVPHSLQGLDLGCEFMLVFDDGEFSEDETFLATETFMRNPASVLSKNLQVDVRELNIPTQELFIFNGTQTPPVQEQNVTGPGGSLSGSEASYTYHWSQQEPYRVPGGSVKILDPTTFPIASTFSAALVTIEPGAMREIHWHSTSDEWNYFLQGSGRITVFAAPSASRTFDFTAGDVGYIERACSHYVENTGIEDVTFLEVLQAPRFTDISLSQWIALTPHQVFKDTVGLSDSQINQQPLAKSYIKPGNPNMLALAGSSAPPYNAAAAAPQEAVGGLGALS